MIITILFILLSVFIFIFYKDNLYYCLSKKTSKRYRIVKDNYCGYEVQVWRIWFPIWIESNYINTHSSLEKAKKHIENLRNYKEYIEN